MSYNPDYTWLLFTDSNRAYQYPDNIIVYHRSFEEIQKLFQSKFNFPICLKEPKKLCDYKPAYGYIFQEELVGYEYWGYCDIDEYYGDLSKWLNTDSLRKYDRLFQLGHMSIYRNCSELNSLFMHDLRNTEGLRITSYQQIFQSNRHFAFDEWLPDCITINKLSEETSISVCWDWPMSDIGPFQSSFVESTYSREKHFWMVNNDSKNCIIVFTKGKLYLYWKANGVLSSKEILYAHLQKRKLDITKYDSSLDYFAIVPNRIISSKSMFTDEEIERMLEQAEIRQWLKIDELKRRCELSKEWIAYQIRKRIGKK